MSAAPETRALDLFVAWWPIRNLYLDLGQIANKSSQRGGYLSGQVQF